MKKTISILLSFILCCSALFAGAVPAGAAPPRYWPIGDADRDYDLTIMDVTRIQRYLAGFYHADPGFDAELYDTLCDADGNGKVTVLDATCLQRYLVDLPCSYRYRELTDYYIGDTSFHSTVEICAPGADSSRGIAYAGVPVTFTARLKWGNPPQTYRFSINGETIAESAAKGERRYDATHTFTDAGTYEVQLDAVCKYGVSKTFRCFVDVIALPQNGRPVVMGAAYFDQTWMSSGNGDLTVTAAGGTAPYQYSFTAYYAEAPIDGIEQGSADVLGSGNPHGMTKEKALVGKMNATGYIQKNTVNPLQMMAHFDCDAYEKLYVCVTVRDAAGRESEPVTVVYYQYEMCL